jgi:hypothetical protein
VRNSNLGLGTCEDIVFLVKSFISKRENVEKFRSRFLENRWLSRVPSPLTNQSWEKEFKVRFSLWKKRDIIIPRLRSDFANFHITSPNNSCIPWLRTQRAHDSRWWLLQPWRVGNILVCKSPSIVVQSLMRHQTIHHNFRHKNEVWSDNLANLGSRFGTSSLIIVALKRLTKKTIS